MEPVEVPSFKESLSSLICSLLFPSAPMPSDPDFPLSDHQEAAVRHVIYEKYQRLVVFPLDARNWPHRDNLKERQYMIEFYEAFDQFSPLSRYIQAEPLYYVTDHHHCLIHSTEDKTKPIALRKPIVAFRSILDAHLFYNEMHLPATEEAIGYAYKIQVDCDNVPCIPLNALRSLNGKLTDAYVIPHGATYNMDPVQILGLYGSITIRLCGRIEKEKENKPQYGAIRKKLNF